MALPHVSYEEQWHQRSWPSQHRTTRSTGPARWGKADCTSVFHIWICAQSAKDGIRGPMTMFVGHYKNESVATSSLGVFYLSCSCPISPFEKQNLYPDCKVTFEMPHQRQYYYWNMNDMSATNDPLAKLKVGTSRATGHNSRDISGWRHAEQLRLGNWRVFKIPCDGWHLWTTKINCFVTFGSSKCTFVPLVWWWLWTICETSTKHEHGTSIRWPHHQGDLVWRCWRLPDAQGR